MQIMQSYFGPELRILVQEMASKQFTFPIFF